MDYSSIFLPSEIARLVLGYLKDNGYPKSYKTFLRECPHLAEYGTMLHQGREFPLTIGGQTLLHMLEEYGRFKVQSLRQDNNSTEILGSTWHSFDTLVTQLKTLSAGRRTGVRTRGPAPNRSNFSRRSAGSSRNSHNIRPTAALSNYMSHLDMSQETESEAEAALDNNVLSSSPCSIPSSHLSPSPVQRHSNTRAVSLEDLRAPPEAFLSSPHNTKTARSRSADRLRGISPCSTVGASPAKVKQGQGSTTKASPGTGLKLRNVPCNSKSFKQGGMRADALRTGNLTSLLVSTTSKGVDKVAEIANHTNCKQDNHAANRDRDSGNTSMETQSEELPSPVHPCTSSNLQSSSHHDAADTEPSTSRPSEDTVDSGIQTPVKTPRTKTVAKDFKSPRRKSQAPKRRSAGELPLPVLTTIAPSDPRGESHNNNSNDSKASSESLGFSMFDELLNNTTIAEKLAENINKIKNTEAELQKVVQNTNSETEKTNEQRETTENKETQPTSGAPLDLDLLLAQESQMPEDAVNSIIDMTSKDPAFDALFNIFKVDKNEFIEKEYGISITGSTSKHKDPQVDTSTDAADMDTIASSLTANDQRSLISTEDTTASSPLAPQLSGPAVDMSSPTTAQSQVISSPMVMAQVKDVQSPMVIASTSSPRVMTPGRRVPVMRQVAEGQEVGSPKVIELLHPAVNGQGSYVERIQVVESPRMPAVHSSAQGIPKESEKPAASSSGQSSNVFPMSTPLQATVGSTSSQPAVLQLGAPVPPVTRLVQTQPLPANQPILVPAGIPLTGSSILSSVQIIPSSLPTNKALPLPAAPPGKVAIFPSTSAQHRQPVKKKKTRNRAKKGKKDSVVDTDSESLPDSVISESQGSEESTPVAQRTRSRSGSLVNTREVTTIEIGGASMDKSPHRVIEILDTPEKEPASMNKPASSGDSVSSTGLGPGKALKVSGSWEMKKDQKSKSLALVDVKDERRKNLGLPNKKQQDTEQPVSVSTPQVVVSGKILQQLPSGIFTVAPCIKTCSPSLTNNTSTTLNSAVTVQPAKGSGKDHVRNLNFSPPGTLGSLSSKVLQEPTVSFSASSDMSSLANPSQVLKGSKDLKPNTSGSSKTPSKPKEASKLSLKNTNKGAKGKKTQKSPQNMASKKKQENSQSQGSEIDIVSPQASGKAVVSSMSNESKDGSPSSEGVVLSIPESENVTFSSPALSMPMDLDCMFGFQGSLTSPKKAHKPSKLEAHGASLDTINIADIMESSDTNPGQQKTKPKPQKTVKGRKPVAKATKSKKPDGKSNPKKSSLDSSKSPIALPFTKSAISKTASESAGKDILQICSPNTEVAMKQETAQTLLALATQTVQQTSTDTDQTAMGNTQQLASSPKNPNPSVISSSGMKPKVTETGISETEKNKSLSNDIETASSDTKLKQTESGASARSKVVKHKSMSKNIESAIGSNPEVSLSSSGTDSLMTWAVETSQNDPSQTDELRHQTPVKMVRRLSHTDISSIREKRQKNKRKSDEAQSPRVLDAMTDPDKKEVQTTPKQDFSSIGTEKAKCMEKVTKSVHFRDPVASSPLEYRVVDDSCDSCQSNDPREKAEPEASKMPTTNELSSSSNEGLITRGPLKLLPVQCASTELARSLDLTNLIMVSAQIQGKPLLPASPNKAALVPANTLVGASPAKSPAKSVFLAKFIKAGMGSGPVPRSILKSPCPKATSPRASELMSPPQTQDSSQGSDDTTGRGVKRRLESDDDDSREASKKQSKRPKLDKKTKLALLAKMDVDKFLNKSYRKDNERKIKLESLSDEDKHQDAVSVKGGE